MTTTQIKKLHTVIAKLEALENDARGCSVSDYLRNAKSELLRALDQVEK